MDGFHLYRHQLDQAEDPQLMHDRRGAQFTFAPALLLQKLLSLKLGEVTLFPSFSHAEKDPVEDSIVINPEACRVLVLEGLYLFSGLPVWRDIRGLFDYKVFIDGDLDSTMARLLLRNSQALGLSIEQTWQRIQSSDRLNALEVIETRDFADEVVEFVAKPASALEY
jgi:pantothenate kinase